MKPGKLIIKAGIAVNIAIRQAKAADNQATDLVSKSRAYIHNKITSERYPVEY